MLKVLGLLALIAAWLGTLLAFIAPVYSPDLVGRSDALPIQIAREIGRGFSIFVIAAIGASIAAFITRKRRDRNLDFPGLTMGTVLALGYSALMASSLLMQANMGLR